MPSFVLYTGFKNTRHLQHICMKTVSLVASPAVAIAPNLVKKKVYF